MALLAAGLWPRLKVGDIVCMEGPLGAGKTTFVRGILLAAGHLGEVRSPTFNLVHLYDTDPPILHADLYRVSTWSSMGLEDEVEHRISFVEWPDRLEGFADPDACWWVSIEFEGEGRRVTIRPPVLN
jgi:tRNA threonylcarbamoyladenosine biosynthesis protein TsaE